jgi:hypothetical protein
VFPRLPVIYICSMTDTCSYLVGGTSICPFDSTSYWCFSSSGVSNLDGERGKGSTFT